MRCCIRPPERDVVFKKPRGRSGLASRQPVAILVVLGWSVGAAAQPDKLYYRPSTPGIAAPPDGCGRGFVLHCRPIRPLAVGLVQFIPNPVDPGGFFSLRSLRQRELD